MTVAQGAPGTGCTSRWRRSTGSLTDVTVTWRSGGAPAMVNAPPMTQVADGEEADVVVAQRACAYEGLGLWRRWGSDPRRRTVYENDDDVFSITPENTAAWSTYKEGTEVREAVLRYCRTANLVTTTAPHIGDVFREMLDNRVPVEVLPNYVPGWVLDLPRDTTDRRLRVGWMGGSSHSLDVMEAAPGVRRFMQRFRDWDLFINGVDYRTSSRLSPSGRTSSRGFTSPTTRRSTTGPSTSTSASAR